MKIADRSMFVKIRAAIRRVPYGKVATYGSVAYAAGFPGAARQVAWALHSSSGLPWHRILGAGGKILLPGENGFEQRMRLQNEGVAFQGLRVNMKKHEFAFFGRRKPTTETQGRRRSQRTAKKRLGTKRRR